MIHGLLENTYREFIGILEMHTAFMPEDTLLDNNITDVILEECRPISHAIQVCFYFIYRKI